MTAAPTTRRTKRVYNSTRFDNWGFFFFRLSLEPNVGVTRQSVEFKSFAEYSFVYRVNITRLKLRKINSLPLCRTSCL